MKIFIHLVDADPSCPQELWGRFEREKIVAIVEGFVRKARPHSKVTSPKHTMQSTADPLVP